MSQDVVKNFLVENGGVIRNVDLVRHFRKFLQPDDVASKGGRETPVSRLTVFAASKRHFHQRLTIW